MKLKELAAVIMSLAALVSSVTGLVTALRAERNSNQVYQQAAEGVADNAERIAELEKRR